MNWHWKPRQQITESREWLQTSSSIEIWFKAQLTDEVVAR